MSYYSLVCYLLLSGYLLLILIYWVGWILIPEQKKKSTRIGKGKFSVLIPVRNESNVIRQCISAIVNQDFPPENFEIIILDDHSDDETANIVNSCIREFDSHTIRLIQVKDHDNRSGKKEAISLGVGLATNPVVAITDADCLRGSGWLSAIDAFMQTRKVAMIYAPVFFSCRTTFEKIQSLEFSGLVGIGGAAIRLKNPNMCSAANLIFTREAFIGVNGYQDNRHLASGDDEFLLHKVYRKYPGEVFFLKDQDAIVYTSPNNTLNQLAQQRRRWVSKSTHYDERYITAILILAYLFNFTIAFNLIFGIFYPEFLELGLIQLSLKTIVEGLFLFTVNRFFRKTELILFLPLAEPFHIIYVLIIGIWANVQSYTWKERELK